MKKILMSATLWFLVCLALINFFNSNQVYAQEDITLNSKSAILIDYNTNEILYSKNETEKLEIASMVKLMTTLLTIEEIENGTIKLEDELVASSNASSMGGSQVFIDANSKYTINKMLQSVIMASANDASVALAEHISGSENAFVKKMNEKAKELNMNDTVYANSTGLPAPMQHSTAKDTAILLSNLISNEIYHKYSTMWMDELVHPSGRKTEIVNTNKLVRYYQGCDSGKTGFTDEAGYCLACSVKRDDMRLISVVIGANSSKERFNETVELFNFGYANFVNEKIVDKDQLVGQIKVLKSKTTCADVYASEDFYGITKKGETNKFNITLELPISICAPVKANESIGKLIITSNGVVVKEIDLIVLEDIQNLNYFEALDKVINAW